MQTNAVDLRHNMKDIMRAIERQEPVTVLYHGREKAVMRAIEHADSMTVEQHPFFAMNNDKTSVEQVMQSLRGGRFDAL